MGQCGKVSLKDQTRALAVVNMLLAFILVAGGIVLTIHNNPAYAGMAVLGLLMIIGSLTYFCGKTKNTILAFFVISCLCYVVIVPVLALSPGMWMEILIVVGMLAAHMNVWRYYKEVADGESSGVISDATVEQGTGG